MTKEQPLRKHPPEPDRTLRKSAETPLLEVLEELNLPALLIDGQAQLLARTASVESLAGFGPCVPGKRPRHWDRTADERIKRYLQGITAGEGQDAPAPAPLVIDGRRRRPLVIKAIPLSQRPYRDAPAARAVVIIMDLEANPAPSPELLRHIFEFTPAEARLASRLAAGESLADASRSIGISVGTARQQLKVIFAKTGCRRQSELMSLLARLTSLQPDESETGHGGSPPQPEAKPPAP